ncbi:MAG: GTP-binding protein [Methylohalobius sp. ZOD2]|uniref:GTP-binding protein n=1 Tax=Methylohalobius crimeensis TaxID=244365 RepID=UPI0003B4BADD|nr:ATP/GTP-binding protein [Methylohalobius crimeensis]MBN2701347.1 ATP/GTP-binding protein [Methylothermaceae bacterium]
MGQYKLIFTGPVGAGKTTAITTLSDEPPVKTDEVARDMTRQRKPDTTVALDYGVMRLDKGEKLHLYGTPGQERFDFMWDILSSGGIGLILLINNNRPDPFQDLRFFLQRFRSLVDSTAVAVGVTQMDRKPEPLLETYHQALGKQGLEGIPLFEVDARSRTDMSLLVQSLLFTLDPGLKMDKDDGEISTA